jgi:hypothetical protein
MREWRQAHRENRKRAKELRGELEADPHKRERGASRDTPAASAAEKGVTMEVLQTDRMPEAAFEGTLPTAELKPAAAAPDPIGAARALMVDRVRRLMVVATELDTAAAQLETLTGAIIPGLATRAVAQCPEQGRLNDASTHFFDALDHLQKLIENCTARVARQTAMLDRVFDLNVRRSLSSTS